MVAEFRSIFFDILILKYFRYVLILGESPFTGDILGEKGPWAVAECPFFFTLKFSII